MIDDASVKSRKRAKVIACNTLGYIASNVAIAVHLGFSLNLK